MVQSGAAESKTSSKKQSSAASEWAAKRKAQVEAAKAKKAEKELGEVTANHTFKPEIKRSKDPQSPGRHGARPMAPKPSLAMVAAAAATSSALQRKAIGLAVSVVSARTERGASFDNSAQALEQPWPVRPAQSCSAASLKSGAPLAPPGGPILGARVQRPGKQVPRSPRPVKRASDVEAKKEKKQEAVSSTIPVPRPEVAPTTNRDDIPGAISWFGRSAESDWIGNEDLPRLRSESGQLPTTSKLQLSPDVMQAELEEVLRQGLAQPQRHGQDQDREHLEHTEHQEVLEQTEQVARVEQLPEALPEGQCLTQTPVEQEQRFNVLGPQPLAETSTLDWDRRQLDLQQHQQQMFLEFEKFQQRIQHEQQLLQQELQEQLQKTHQRERERCEPQQLQRQQSERQFQQFPELQPQRSPAKVPQLKLPDRPPPQARKQWLSQESVCLHSLDAMLSALDKAYLSDHEVYQGYLARISKFDARCKDLESRWVQHQARRALSTEGDSAGNRSGSDVKWAPPTSDQELNKLHEHRTELNSMGEDSPEVERQDNLVDRLAGLMDRISKNSRKEEVQAHEIEKDNKPEAESSEATLSPVA
eukprot:TRINITY_DN51152_c0_g1_i1.p1 TRINITY_DN51152_c0_g1~~TRINITY_DN51152_c0_g1_i1.p1  ORF type:complete len:602 (-),score=150.27 TRINITY_DN51152_c0_g1_i1:33-1799(-)